MRSRGYEAFIVTDEPEDPNDAIPLALKWLRDWGDSAVEGALVTPVADQYGYSRLSSVLRNVRPGQAFRLGKRLVLPLTWKTYQYGPKAGPLLALWTDEKFLEKLHGYVSFGALCVVPGSAAKIMGWIRAMHPTDLRGRPQAEPAVLSPAVEEAMDGLSLSINQNNGLIQYEDKKAAIRMLRRLLTEGHPYDPVELQAWALAHEWVPDTARRLREYAEGVRQGKRYRVGGTPI
jgi:hypothetical protein